MQAVNTNFPSRDGRNCINSSDICNRLQVAFRSGTIAAKATDGEVLVSATVKDLVAGSGIRVEERGLHNLVSEERRLYAAKTRS